MNQERGARLRLDVETATRGAMLRAPTDGSWKVSTISESRIATMNLTLGARPSCRFNVARLAIREAA